MRNATCAFSVIICSAVTMAAAPPQYVTYRVMTYNVGSAAHIPMERRQIEQIADTIVDNAVDIAGFCEVSLGNAWRGGRDHIAEIGVALADRGYAMHACKYPVNPALGGWQVNAILSRWPIAHSDRHTFAPPAMVPWHVGEIRVDVSTQTSVRAYMTHIWPPSLHADTIEQAVAMPLAMPGPATIMGDFNLATDSSIYPLITKQGWQNSCEAVGGVPCPTVGFGAYVAGPLPLTGQIDFIFGNGDIEFIDSYVHYYSMSDHWPVIAVCRVKAEGERIAPATRYIGVKPTLQMRLRQRAAEFYRYKEYAKSAEAWLECESACRDPESAGFSAYSAACMMMLAGDGHRAAGRFEEVVAKYPGSEWAARSHQRRAFLFKDDGDCRAAERELLAFLYGYYDAIHSAPRSPAVMRVAQEVSRIRATDGGTSTQHDVLNELIKADPEGMVTRSIHYNLGMDALLAEKMDRAREHLLKSRPIPQNHYRSEAKMLADMYLEAGDSVTATKFFLQYVGSDANQTVYRAELARWGQLVGRERPRLEIESKSVELHLRAAPMSTQDPLVISHLAQPQPGAVTDEHAAVVGFCAMDESVEIRVVVSDSRHYAPYRNADIWRGDCVQIAFDPQNDSDRGYDDDDFEFGVALTDEGPRAHLWVDQRGRDVAGIGLEAIRFEADGTTHYTLSIPNCMLETEGVMPGKVGFNIMIADNDGAGRVQWLDWTPGIGGQKAPDVFGVLQFK